MWVAANLDALWLDLCRQLCQVCGDGALRERCGDNNARNGFAVRVHKARLNMRRKPFEQRLD